MQRLFTASLLILSFAFPFEAVAQTIFPNRGGTGATTTPAYGDILVGNATGTFSVRSTSSLGISAGGTGPATSTNPLIATYVVATGSATSSVTNFSVSTAISFLGDYITNVTTWVRGKIDAYLSGGDGITYSSGAISFDCSEVEGTGINCSANDITLDATGDWTGIFDGFEGSYFLANSFSTTSADVWKNTRNFFSTSSTAYWETQQTARTADDLSDNTTSDLAEGSRLYWTNARFDARLAGSSTIPTITTLLGLTSVGTITTGTWQGTPIADAYLIKTGAWTGTFDGLEGTGYLARANHTGTQAASTVTGGTFGSGSFVFPSGSLSALGSTTLQDFTANRSTTSQATTTVLRTTTLGVGSDYLTDITGSGLQLTSGALTLDATGAWTGTFDGQEGSYYLANSFSTTSASYFLSQNQGAAFSTTSTNYWETQQTARTADDLTNNSIEDLNDVAAMTENYGDLLFWNGSSWADKATSSLNISWSHLIDMPAGFADGVDNTGGAPSWGTITGTLSDQTDLQAALNLKLDRSASSSLPNLVTFGSSSATTTAAGNLAVSGDVAADQLFATGATSTFANGLNLLTGCIAYNGTCLSTGGGSQTPWTSNIDGGGYNLTNTGSITAHSFVSTSTAGTSSFQGPVQFNANANYGGSNPGEGVVSISMGAHSGSAFNVQSSSSAASGDGELFRFEQGNINHANELIKIENASTQGGSEEWAIISPVPDWYMCDNTDSDNDCVEGEVENHGSWLFNSRNSGNTAFERNVQIAAARLGGMVCLGGAFNCPFTTAKLLIVGTSTLDYLNVNRPNETGSGGNVFNINNNQNVGVGTTTPWGSLSVTGTSTRPAFVVASSTGSQMLTIGGLANTIMELFANTGTKLLSAVSEVVTLLGTWDFSGATVKIHTYPAFSYPTSTAWIGTTTIPLGPAYTAESWAGVKCFTDTGTLWVNFNDGTNKTNHLQASTTVGSVTLSSNNTWTASEKRYVEIGNPASSPTKISCTVDKVVNN